MNDDERAQLAASLRRHARDLLVVSGRHAEAAADAIEELVQEKNAAYAERNLVLALAARLALEVGHAAYIGFDHEHANDPAWEGWLNVVYIILPTGQLAWHVSDEEALYTFDAFLSRLAFDHHEYDGHSTEDKYERLRSYIAGYQPDAPGMDRVLELTNQRNRLAQQAGPKYECGACAGDFRLVAPPLEWDGGPMCPYCGSVETEKVQDTHTTGG